MDGDESQSKKRTLWLVASKDEPRGISDDVFLSRALRRSRAAFDWVLWDALPIGWQKNRGNRIIPLVRSLWEGRDQTGATIPLKNFFASCCEAVPEASLDFQLLQWICHKRYLIELIEDGVPCIPTKLVTRSPRERKSSECVQSEHHDVCGSTCEDSKLCHASATPGSIKRAMLSRGWCDAVLKPAVGTRCEGVLWLSCRPGQWTIEVAKAVSALLEKGDCLLQPFLSRVRVPSLPQHGSHPDSTRNCRSELWGEFLPITRDRSPSHLPDIFLSWDSCQVCVVCVDGKPIHAIHKHPRDWGWHSSQCPCATAKDDEALAKACCECDYVDGSPPTSNLKNQTAAGLKICTPTIQSGEDSQLMEIAGNESEDGSKLMRKLRKAPVQGLQLPLPPAMMRPINAALSSIRKRFQNQHRTCPTLCRIDLLPRLSHDQKNSKQTAKRKINDIGVGLSASKIDDSTWHESSRDQVEWLVSEIEGEWCECFQRAAPSTISDQIISAILRKGQHQAT